MCPPAPEGWKAGRMGCFPQHAAHQLPRCVFFFQAEDGIRDLTVTGVQTCALPISALGLERGIASMVQLERGRGNICNLRRAATIRISASLIRPSFDKPNIGDKSE